MANHFEVVGNINPTETIQLDTRACLPACLLGEVNPDLDLSEADIIEVMTEDGLFTPGEFGGTGLYPARTLSATTEKIGLITDPVFDARLASKHEGEHIDQRLLRIGEALREGSHVILGYPKRREGKAPFLHYSTVTGYELTPEGPVVTIMDPSDVDGGVKHVAWSDFFEYITPTDEIPVMAWGVRQLEDGSLSSVHATEEQDLPGFSLLATPLANDVDTGKAVPPGTNHPSSVVMPTSEITKQFNEIGDIILSRDGELPIGYPRFLVPGTVKELSLANWGEEGRLPFPTLETAQAAAHLALTYGDPSKAIPEERDGLFWLPAGSRFNIEGWQHTGLGVSSRQALATLEGQGENDLDRRVVAENTIKRTIERYTGARVNDIYLFPTGMSAIYTLNQALARIAGDDAPAVQFGFPYTDTFDQRKFGPSANISKNVVDLRNGDYDALAELVASGQPIRHIMTELPGNPKLGTPDFERLDAILDGEAPIVIDDTIGTFFNIDDAKLPANVVARVTSLTKFFSSVGDVMGGSIVLRRNSPYYALLKREIEATYQDTLWHEDAEKLADNSRYFPEIMPVINESAARLTEWLVSEQTGAGRPIEAVYHPTTTGRAEFDAVRRSDAGHGGLMSLKFNYPDAGYRFFDRLQVTKGPSLGTYFSLACLYTWLAHKPVESVEKFGVAPDLVRLSVGVEGFDDLQARVQEALYA
jgi:cystathionine gamma-synthase